MTPLSEHQLLIFWLQLFVLVAAARGLGGLMRRVGQPAVVGELAAGLLLGPSLLGRVAPDLYGYLFPSDAVQSGALLAVAWIGVGLLMVVTGFETDLKLLTSLGRSSVLVSTGSLVVPLVFGVALGLLLPSQFLVSEDLRLPFALFMAVALAVSSLPVVAKILMDMGLMRRNIGQVIVAGGMANDLVGWILLGTLAGIVTGGGFAVGGLLTSVGAILAFLVLSLSVGQRVTDAGLRRARQISTDVVAPLSVVLLVTLGFATVTQALGVEAVIGAFVAGIVVGRSRYLPADARHAIEGIVDSFVAPVFFATAGLSVDLGLLADPTTATWAVVVVVVATVSKLIGSYAGAVLGGMSAMEGLAVSAGLNARGAVGLVIATIGLTLEVLNIRSYTIIVVMAVVTSMMAPPLLRAALTRVRTAPEETARLEREAMLQASVIAGTRTALLPTRGGENSLLAARILDLSLQPDTDVVICTVHGDDPAARSASNEAAREVRAAFHGRGVQRHDRRSDDTAEAICDEARLGYGLVGLGMTEHFTGGGGMSRTLRALLTRCPVPMLLVKHGATLDPHASNLRFRRVLVPIAGTRTAQAAQEVAYTLADRVHAPVEAVHVVSRPAQDEPVPAGARAETGGAPVPTGVLEEARVLATKFGQQISMSARHGLAVGPELVAAADEIGADLVVLGSQARSYADGPFLGHGVEYVLEHASQTVLVVVFPAERSPETPADVNA